MTVFYDSTHFPFTAMLEESYPIIRDEVERLTHTDFRQWPEVSATTAPGRNANGWWMYGLFGETFPGMSYLYDAEANISKCPKTAAICRRIPGLTDAGFSALLPNTHIQPHEGLEPHLLRCHLGLYIPTDTAILAGGIERTWEEGKCLVFDDTHTHEAWNFSNSIRIILLVAFRRADYGL